MKRTLQFLIFYLSSSSLGNAKAIKIWPVRTAWRQQIKSPQFLKVGNCEATQGPGEPSVRRCCWVTPREGLTSGPQPQELGCNLGVNLNILEMYQQKGWGGQLGQRLPKAESIELSAGRGAQIQRQAPRAALCLGSGRPTDLSSAPFPHTRPPQSSRPLQMRFGVETAALRGLGF